MVVICINSNLRTKVFFFFFSRFCKAVLPKWPKCSLPWLGFGLFSKCTKCGWLVFTPQIVSIYWEICLVLSWIDRLSWLFKREGSVIVKGQRNRFQGSKAPSFKIQSTGSFWVLVWRIYPWVEHQLWLCNGLFLGPIQWVGV